MKKGKVVYKSGKLTATVDDEESYMIWIEREGGTCDEGLGMGLDDVKDLREILRLLETYKEEGK